MLLQDQSLDVCHPEKKPDLGCGDSVRVRQFLELWPPETTTQIMASSRATRLSLEADRCGGDQSDHLNPL